MSFRSLAAVALSVTFLLCDVKGEVTKAGETDPVFQRYLHQCATTGCLNSVCIPGCVPEVAPAQTEEGDLEMEGNTSAAVEAASQRNVTDPWPLVLGQWDCLSECKYQTIMFVDEEERKGDPVKYYGKWPLQRVYFLEEPVSAILSAVAFLVVLWNTVTFAKLAFSPVPTKASGANGQTYEYAGVFLVAGLLQAAALATNFVYHARNTHDLDRLNWSCSVASLALGLVTTIIRTAGLQAEAARVAVAATIISFTASHLSYCNWYKEVSFYDAWNYAVCSVFAGAQILLWAIWAGLTFHPAALKLWVATIAFSASYLLWIYDFPPYEGLIDAHAAWHATVLPAIILWWSFLKEDVKFRASGFLKKKTRRSAKKTN